MLLLLHKTLKGSWSIQGFALIRAILFSFVTFEEKVTEGKKKICFDLELWTSITCFVEFAKNGWLDSQNLCRETNIPSANILYFSSNGRKKTS